MIGGVALLAAEVGLLRVFQIGAPRQIVGYGLGFGVSVIEKPLAGSVRAKFEHPAPVAELNFAWYERRVVAVVDSQAKITVPLFRKMQGEPLLLRGASQNAASALIPRLAVPATLYVHSAIKKPSSNLDVEGIVGNSRRAQID